MVHLPNVPSSYQIMLILTHECNLKCSYCYEHNREKVLVDKEKMKQIISYYLNSTKYEEIIIEFFGGEPWLKKDTIIELCEWTWSLQWRNKYRFFTSTNGTLIHGEIQQWLHKHNKKISCGLSLDGMPQIHNANRCNSYHNIDINFFLENWPTQPIKMTISPQSLKFLAKNIIYIHSLGFNLAGTNFAEGIDWSNPSYVAILYKQLATLVDFYIENPTIPIAPIINMPIEYCEYEKINQPNKYCAVRGLLAYDTDGTPYPCNFITPMTFSQEKLSKLKLTDFEDDNNLIDKYCYNQCYFYNICPNCYGANLLVNNNLAIRDKSACNLIKLRAYFSAVLKAHNIIRNKANLSQDNDVIALEIKAIENIKTICEEGVIKTIKST